MIPNNRRGIGERWFWRTLIALMLGLCAGKGGSVAKQAKARPAILFPQRRLTAWRVNRARRERTHTLNRACRGGEESAGFEVGRGERSKLTRGVSLPAKPTHTAANRLAFADQQVILTR